MEELPAVVVIGVGILAILLFITLLLYLVKGEEQLDRIGKRYFHRRGKPLKEK